MRADPFGDTTDEHRGGPSTGNGLTADTLPREDI
jgi:hypothetical protein